MIQAPGKVPSDGDIINQGQIVPTQAQTICQQTMKPPPKAVPYSNAADKFNQIHMGAVWGTSGGP